MTHAGFWVDGAVRLPEARHGNLQKLVFIKWKDSGDFGTLFADVAYSRWCDVYWLDTTPRESLTPEELYSVVKVLFPSAVNVVKVRGGEWKWNGEFDINPHIDWGNVTQYPPPVEPQWVRITRENVGQYLFRECRFRDADCQEWKVGKVSGWDEQDGCCLVNSDFEEEMPIMQWNIVEVQSASTP